MAQVTVLRQFFEFLLRCWLCAAGWKLRLPSCSVHINMLRGFGTVIACSVPPWRTNPLGREHMPWVGNMSLLCCPSGSVDTRHRRQSLRSCAFAVDLTIPSFYQKHLELLSSYSVRILKLRNQSFYIQTKAETYEALF